MDDVNLHTISVDIEAGLPPGVPLPPRVDTLMKVSTKGPGGVFAVARQQSAPGDLYVLDWHVEVCSPIAVLSDRERREPKFCLASGAEAIRVPMFPYVMPGGCDAAALTSLGFQLARAVWLPGVSSVYLLVSGLFAVSGGTNDGKVSTHVYVGIAARRVS